MSPHLRQTLRRALQSPIFPLLVVFTLALGLGANSALFSVVNTILLKPLPYVASERLVMLDHAAPGLDLPRLDISESLFLFYRDQAKSFESISLVSSREVTFTGADQPQRLHAGAFTPGSLAMLRVAPLFGRAFTTEEGAPGAQPVVLLSEELWRTRFGAKENVLGTLVEVDGVAREVVGVLPRGFAFPESDLDLWTPYAIDRTTARLGNFAQFAIARLAPGATLESARAELDHFLVALRDHFPEDQAAVVLDEAGFRAHPRTLRDHVVGDVATSLWLLLGTVVFVLLIACANVANLFLVRAEGRQRETAVRTALGAGRRDHVRSSLLESTLLVTIAALVGLGLAHRALHFLRLWGPQDLPRLAEITLDGRTLGFTAVLALAASLLFGLLPLAFTKVQNLAGALKDGGRAATGGRERLHLRRLLVAGQVALALVLLVGATLMLRSFQNLVQVDPGFRVDHTLSFRLSLPETNYPDDRTAADFWFRLQDRLAALPGVESVATVSSVPLGGARRRTGHRLESQHEVEGALPIVFAFEVISEGYLKTAGLRLLEGRSLDRSDSERRSASILVSESLARQNWPGESALGQRLDPGSLSEDPWYTVVGVVADVRARNLAEEPEPTVYYPLLSKDENGWVMNGMDVVLRSKLPHDTLMNTVRQAVWDLDADLPLTNVRTFEQLVSESRARHSFTLTLLLIASLMSLALSAVGTYGVIAYLVAQRTGEIGIRLALGARGTQVATLVLREGLLVATAGAAAGLLGAAALTRWLKTLLFEVSPLDPLTFAVVPALLLTAALLACWIPARKASRVDPLVALRHD